MGVYLTYAFRTPLTVPQAVPVQHPSQLWPGGQADQLQRPAVQQDPGRRLKRLGLPVQTLRPGPPGQDAQRSRHR